MTVAPGRPSNRRLAHAAQLVPAGLVSRRVRAEAGIALATAVLVAVTCGVFAALPRLSNRFADRGLHYTLAHAAAIDRNVQATETARVGAGSDAKPLARVGQRAVQVEQTLPRPLRGLVGSRAFVVRSQQYSAAGPPGVQRILTLVEQSGVQSNVRVVAGRMPRPSRATVTANATANTFGSFGALGQELSRKVRVPVLEIALSTQTAHKLFLHVGDRIVLGTDQTTGTEFTPAADERPIAVQVVGLFAVPHPDDPFWFEDTRLNVPELVTSQDLSTTDVYGEALLSPAQYPTMLAATHPLGLSYEYRYFTDGRHLNASQAGKVRAAAAELNARYAGAGPLERKSSTGLDSVLAQYRGERSQAETLLAVATFSLLACALANLGLLAALSFDRRRTETGLARTRGALPRQVLLTQLLEGLLLAVPAGLAGWGVAVLAVHGRGSTLSVWLAVAVVVGAVLLQAAGVARHARRSLRPPERDVPPTGRASPRRLVIEALVVVLAGLGVYLLRRRGLSSAQTGVDPYLAAVPVLLALASGIVALRLYPLPVGAAARIARRSRGLTLHLALSRAARQSEVALAPLLVLVLALSLAVFSVAMLKTLEAGQTRTASREVGADARVDAAPGRMLPASLVTRLRREGTVAPAFVLDSAVDQATEDTIFVAVDTRAYAHLAGAAAPRALDALNKPAPLGGFVRALTSPDWPGGSPSQLEVQQAFLNLVTTAHAGTFPGLPTGVPFAVASLQAIERQTHTKMQVNRLYLGGVGASTVRRAVAAAAPGASVTSRSDVVAQLRASPFVSSVLDGFRLAIALAVLYAVVAVVLLALIASRSRARDLALVRTMGGSPRNVLELAAVELVPPLLVALALGIGLGVALAHLVAPAIDFSFFTGDTARLLSVPWAPTLGLAGGAVAAVAAAVAVTSARARGAELSRVLRFGER
ncbi:MAG TPA: FtsX-like permease family protein [Gaiellaceae bacterium]|nr:FtsX-like permease family protein [Gaiellaceae bacterium]